MRRTSPQRSRTPSSFFFNWLGKRQHEPSPHTNARLSFATLETFTSAMAPAILLQLSHFVNKLASWSPTPFHPRRGRAAPTHASQHHAHWLRAPIGSTFERHNCRFYGVWPHYYKFAYEYKSELNLHQEERLQKRNNCTLNEKLNTQLHKNIKNRYRLQRSFAPEKTID